MTQGYKPGQGSSLDNSIGTDCDKNNEFVFESYTISRDNTESPDIVDMDFKGGQLQGESESLKDDWNTGHPGLGSIPGRQLGAVGPQQMVTGLDEVTSTRVATIGVLHVPDIGHGALSSPLGSVPSLGGRRDLGLVPPSGNEYNSIEIEKDLTTSSYNEFEDHLAAADGMSDHGKVNEDLNFDDDIGLGEDFQGGKLDSAGSSDLETALQNLTPAEVDRRRRMRFSHR